MKVLSNRAGVEPGGVDRGVEPFLGHTEHESALTPYSGDREVEMVTPNPDRI